MLSYPQLIPGPFPQPGQTGPSPAETMLRPLSGTARARKSHLTILRNLPTTARRLLRHHSVTPEGTGPAGEVVLPTSVPMESRRPLPSCPAGEQKNIRLLTATGGCGLPAEDTRSPPRRTLAAAPSRARAAFRAPSGRKRSYLGPVATERRGVPCPLSARSFLDQKKRIGRRTALPLDHHPARRGPSRRPRRVTCPPVAPAPASWPAPSTREFRTAGSAEYRPRHRIGHVRLWRRAPVASPVPLLRNFQVDSGPCASCATSLRNRSGMSLRRPASSARRRGRSRGRRISGLAKAAKALQTMALGERLRKSAGALFTNRGCAPAPNSPTPLRASLRRPTYPPPSAPPRQRSAGRALPAKIIVFRVPAPVTLEGGVLWEGGEAEGLGPAREAASAAPVGLPEIQALARSWVHVKLPAQASLQGWSVLFCLPIGPPAGRRSPRAGRVTAERHASCTPRTFARAAARSPHE